MPNLFGSVALRSLIKTAGHVRIRKLSVENLDTHTHTCVNTIVVDDALIRLNDRAHAEAPVGFAGKRRSEHDSESDEHFVGLAHTPSGFKLFQRARALDSDDIEAAPNAPLNLSALNASRVSASELRFARCAVGASSVLEFETGAGGVMLNAAPATSETTARYCLQLPATRGARGQTLVVDADDSDTCRLGWANTTRDELTLELEYVQKSIRELTQTCARLEASMASMAAARAGTTSGSAGVAAASTTLGTAAVRTVTGSCEMNSDDELILVDHKDSAEITLPAQPRTHQCVAIQDATGRARFRPIQIKTPAGASSPALINGAQSHSINTPYLRRHFMYTAGGWLMW